MFWQGEQKVSQGYSPADENAGLVYALRDDDPVSDLNKTEKIKLYYYPNVWAYNSTMLIPLFALPKSESFFHSG